MSLSVGSEIGPRKQTLLVRTLNGNNSTDAQGRTSWAPLSYESIWTAMRAFTAQRNAHTHDEVWLLNHEPVFTQGQAGKAEHILVPGDIPVVQIDRGGQVTYHGPGQLVVYLLLDVRRSNLGVRELVERIERSIIDVLTSFGITGESERKAPGVYVNGAKIAALGLRIRNGCSYHGLSFNVAMDLAPFLRINPCGYAGMTVTQLSELIPNPQSSEKMMDEVAHRLSLALIDRLAYSDVEYVNNELPPTLVSKG